MVHLLKWKGVGANDRVLMTVKPSVDFYAITIAVFVVGKGQNLVKFKSLRTCMFNMCCRIFIVARICLLIYMNCRGE